MMHTGPLYPVVLCNLEHWKMSDGGRPLFSKSKNCRICAEVWPIATKLGKMRQIDPLNCTGELWPLQFKLLKVKNGRRLPF